MNENITTKKTLGTFLSELRKEKGYTQGELADILHISNKTVSSWETDKTQPDVQMIPLLANIFDITCDELLNCQKNDTIYINSKKDNLNIIKSNIRLKINRIITIVLSFILVAMCIWFYDVLAQLRTGFPPFETKIVNDVAYRKNVEGTWSVIGLADNFRGNTVILKNTINGIEVTKIDSHAFRDVISFESIIFSEHITSIDSSAFMHCSVNKVVLNEGLLKIEKHAFSHSSIKEIHLPDTLMNIAAQAFDSCVDLKKITGGKGLLFVENSAFRNCVSLESLFITGEVTFGSSVFENTTNLINAELPNVIKLGSYQFNKSGLVNLYLPSNWNKVSSIVVYECYRLKSIYFGDKLQNKNDVLL